METVTSVYKVFMGWFFTRTKVY